MLKIENLDVFYGEVQIIYNVSFEIKKGEIVSLIGTNGSGKTTILRTISGLVKPKKGFVELNGVYLHKLPAYKIISHGIAHVPEARRLFTEMSVYENLLLGALTPEAKKSRNEMIEWVFSLFPILKERAKQRAGTLSGGEQQMAAIARGLMSKPSILMLDEPSLGLSPLLVNEIFKIIENIHKEGVTVLIVEQNVYKTLSMTDRAYVLENGKIVMEGAGSDLINNEYVKKTYLGI
jgi:branched-chain amino acid transport system ATP-binding protein